MTKLNWTRSNYQSKIYKNGYASIHCGGNYNPSRLEKTSEKSRESEKCYQRTNSKLRKNYKGPIPKNPKTQNPKPKTQRVCALQSKVIRCETTEGLIQLHRIASNSGVGKKYSDSSIVLNATFNIRK